MATATRGHQRAGRIRPDDDRHNDHDHYRRRCRRAPRRSSRDRIQKPSGNIGCAISRTFVNCTIAEADWAPPGDEACPTDAGRFVTFTGEVPGVQCGAPDTPTGAVFPYDRFVTRGAFRCVSRESSLSSDDGGHGFFLARQGFDAH